MHPTLKIGNSRFQGSQLQVSGKIIEIAGESFYCSEKYDRIPPFFMSIVSHSDHWIFISSTGGLTAGRENAESAIFPYGTDDKVSGNQQTTGSLSILHVSDVGSTLLWKPFSDRYSGNQKIERKPFKKIIGNTLIFEESNRDLVLTYRQNRLITSMKLDKDV